MSWPFISCPKSCQTKPHLYHLQAVAAVCLLATSPLPSHVAHCSSRCHEILPAAQHSSRGSTSQKGKAKDAVWPDVYLCRPLPPSTSPLPPNPLSFSSIFSHRQRLKTEMPPTEAFLQQPVLNNLCSQCASWISSISSLSISSRLPHYIFIVFLPGFSHLPSSSP